MASYLEDIEFILSEVRRFNELVQRQKIDEIGRFDALCSLPRHGTGFWICGEAAERRLIEVASKCISGSPKTHGKLDVQDVLPLLKQGISRHFIYGGLELNAKTAVEIVRNARESAASSMVAIVHFVPCLLAPDEQHKEFRFGPVLFLEKERAITEVRKKIKDGGSKQLNEALNYYSKFPWVARVEQPPCSMRVSRKRTEDILSYVFDALTAIFTAAGSNKMGFSNIPPPKTESFSITISNGEPKAGLSLSWNSHNLTSNWLIQLRDFGFDQFVDAVGNILNDAFYADKSTPLAERFLNAVKWYGDAARESFPGSRIVKFATSIEALAATGHSQLKEKAFKERGCALIEGFESEDVRGTRKRLGRLYRHRSDIVHGRVPFHHPLWPEAHDAEWLCRHALFGAIQFFNAIGLNNHKLLIPSFEKIIAENEFKI